MRVTRVEQITVALDDEEAIFVDGSVGKLRCTSVVINTINARTHIEHVSGHFVGSAGDLGVYYTYVNPDPTPELDALVESVVGLGKGSR